MRNLSCHTKLSLTDKEYVVWILELWDFCQTLRATVPCQWSANWKQTPCSVEFLCASYKEEKARTQTMTKLYFDG